MTSRPGRAVRMSYLVASVAGIGFFFLSVALLGVWPSKVLEQDMRAMAPTNALGLSASELRGRAIYGREGCAYCHTQQVRFVDADMVRFGAPTLAWETRLDYPQLWGTRRIGPDLAREGGTRSTDWQLAHLYAPRSIVPTSVMPAYRSLFDGAADRPRQEARDLVGYLDSLGRAREVAGPEGEAQARAACNCEDDAMAQMAFHDMPLNAHPARARRGHPAPVLPPPADDQPGPQLFADHCAGCHGPRGTGDGAGGVALWPRPGNLAEHDYTDERLADILWNGVVGTAMPAWRDRPLAQLSALAQRVRTMRGDHVDPPAAPGSADLGARVYGAHCAQCHGDTGAGDGTAAAAMSVAPVSFRQQRPSLAAAVRAVRSGIPGTDMAPWTTRLSDAEVVAVAHYVRGMFGGADGVGR